ncbi:MerR family transcriptional regulator [Nitratireductor sp. CAU 1489]|uniref:MerR family transcriptional regulator n=1 Tax=Nitratireductor arenosus TaxID=2682096 RepID=A0A844QEV1_9HYPH|nr:MerR family DNA-binding transcriptional regulator [Nitratireductor arenosus]MVA98496.1 MerR family transcriptional regulator [Nitratireductor arenosus]
MKTVSAIEAMANASEAFAETHDSYARIGDLAKTHGVSLRALRFYEDKGLLSPRRDGSARLYSRRESARLKLILLGRQVGFSLREIKQMLDLYDPSGNNVKQLRVTLEKSQKQLARLQKQRAAITEAIEQLETAANVVRDRLSERTVSAAAS